MKFKLLFFTLLFSLNIAAQENNFPPICGVTLGDEWSKIVEKIKSNLPNDYSLEKDWSGNPTIHLRKNILLPNSNSNNFLKIVFQSENNKLAHIFCTYSNQNAYSNINNAQAFQKEFEVIYKQIIGRFGFPIIPLDDINSAYWKFKNATMSYEKTNTGQLGIISIIIDLNDLY